MVKNTEWENAEEEFYKAFNSKKDRYCHRFLDTRDMSRIVNQRGDLFGKKVMVKAPSQPSDFIVVKNRVTFFADVKSTTSKRGISSSLFKSQTNHKLRILNASGNYFFYIKRLETNEWYVLPGDFEKLNTTWEELKYFKVNIWK